MVAGPRGSLWGPVPDDTGVLAGPRGSLWGAQWDSHLVLASLSPELPGCYLQRERTPDPGRAPHPRQAGAFAALSRGDTPPPGQEAVWGLGRGPAEPTPSLPSQWDPQASACGF